MSILFYRRPDYAEKASGFLDQSACQKYVERAKLSKNKPPPELSFDNIVGHKTLPVSNFHQKWMNDSDTIAARHS